MFDQERMFHAENFDDNLESLEEHLRMAQENHNQKEIDRLTKAIEENKDEGEPLADKSNDEYEAVDSIPMSVAKVINIGPCKDCNHKWCVLARQTIQMNQAIKRNLHAN
jgi:hypothetical protein